MWKNTPQSFYTTSTSMYQIYNYIICCYVLATQSKDVYIIADILLFKHEWKTFNIKFFLMDPSGNEQLMNW